MPDPADLAAIRARHLGDRLWGRTMYEGHIAVDLAAVCDEVERLRLALWEAERALDGERRNREAAVTFEVEQRSKGSG